jgi:hypothetical protein
MCPKTSLICRAFAGQAPSALAPVSVEMPADTDGCRRVLDNGEGSWSKTPRGSVWSPTLSTLVFAQRVTWFGSLSPGLSKAVIRLSIVRSATSSVQGLSWFTPSMGTGSRSRRPW